MRRLKHPAFQRRHYDRIAKVLFDYKLEHLSHKPTDQKIEKAINDQLVACFVQMFNADNPNFSPDRFREAVNFGYGIGVPRPRPPRKRKPKLPKNVVRLNTK